MKYKVKLKADTPEMWVDLDHIIPNTAIHAEATDYDGFNCIRPERMEDGRYRLNFKGFADTRKTLFGEDE